MATEKRLIKEDALLRRLCSERDEVKPKTACDIGYHNGLNMAASMVINTPTVDAVEVVRCKDCKHYDNSEGICWCKLNSKFYPGGFDWHSFPEDGFCSYGERKDND